MTPRILLVEDEPSLMRAFARVLVPFGMVVPVVSVVEALTALNDGTFDLVVTDHDLPDGTGLAVIAAARASSPWARRILVTGNDAVDLAEHVRLNVVQAALLKPFLNSTLVGVVTRLLPAKAGDDASIEE